MARYRDDGEVQIDNSTKVHFRNAFQQLIMIAALNVGTLLVGAISREFSANPESSDGLKFFLTFSGLDVP